MLNSFKKPLNIFAGIQTSIELLDFCYSDIFMLATTISFSWSVFDSNVTTVFAVVLS